MEVITSYSFFYKSICYWGENIFMKEMKTDGSQLSIFLEICKRPPRRKLMHFIRFDKNIILNWKVVKMFRFCFQNMYMH